MSHYTFTVDDMAEIEALRRTRYNTWEWNWGGSPPCDLVRKGHIKGCGSVECRFHIQSGTIRNAVFCGDFFSAKDPELLAERFVGLRPTGEDYRKALSGIDVSEYFLGLSNDAFLSILI